MIREAGWIAIYTFQGKEVTSFPLHVFEDPEDAERNGRHREKPWFPFARIARVQVRELRPPPAVMTTF